MNNSKENKIDIDKTLKAIWEKTINVEEKKDQINIKLVAPKKKMEKYNRKKFKDRKQEYDLEIKI